LQQAVFETTAMHHNYLTKNNQIIATDRLTVLPGHNTLTFFHQTDTVKIVLVVVLLLRI